MSKVTAPGSGPEAAASGKKKRSFSKRLVPSGRAGGGGKGGSGASGPAVPALLYSARSVALRAPPRTAAASAAASRPGGRRAHAAAVPAAARLSRVARLSRAAEQVPGVVLGQYRAGRPEPSPDPEQPTGRRAQGQGEVTEQLAHLVRALWTLEYTPQHSRDFKTIVSKNALQYRGNSQHDAQEFLLWLLDRVHEDLNHSVKQSGQPPLKPPSETDMMPEGPSFPVCSTFVQELFQAQYRSSLTCPHCQKQSNTFDPFLCQFLYPTQVYQGKCSHCMRIGVAVPLSGTVARLREAVSMETKVPTDQEFI
nr:ubiquitin carboxyl-terminal hydrolase 31-like [Pongo pygmaeus]